MTARRLTVELPEAIFQHLERIAELTNQSLEVLAAQSIVSNLPPSADSAPPEMQAELIAMQGQPVEELRKITLSKVPSPQQQRHLQLLEKNQTGSITPEERQELSNLRLAADRLMLCKAYARAVLRWRGDSLRDSYASRVPALEDLPQE